MKNKNRTKKYLTYLAGPYSNPDPVIQNARYIILTRAAGWLMNEKGWNVFSPITHSHPLHLFAEMRGDWAFWKKIDTQYVKLSKRLVVLTIPGWQESVGVTAEVKIAHQQGIPVFYLKTNFPLTKPSPGEEYTLSKTP